MAQWTYDYDPKLPHNITACRRNDGSFQTLTIGGLRGMDFSLTLSADYGQEYEDAATATAHFRDSNGGGPSVRTVEALTIFKQAMVNCQNDGVVNAYRSMLDPADLADWVWRHTDSPNGRLGLSVGSDGAYALAVIPGDKDIGSRTSVLFLFSPRDTPASVYGALAILYEAMGLDNQSKRGGTFTP
jgi:hypothetical protein